jgi:dTDP-4-dehydrorhamnose 3,5-epimerase
VNISSETKIKSAIKDKGHVTSNWEIAGSRIDGVKTWEVKNLLTKNGYLTELFRNDWNIFPYQIEHLIHVVIRPNMISAWHMHKFQTDHIFVLSGIFKVVLYDSREASSTLNQVDVYHLSLIRPTLLIIPPGIWHGVQNLTNENGSFINFFNKQYNYEDPDEWRLPLDTEEIPYKF